MSDAENDEALLGGSVDGDDDDRDYDEDALLADNVEEETGTEDILELEVDEVDLDETFEKEKNVSKASTSAVSTTTNIDDSIASSDAEQTERSHRFKNERFTPVNKVKSIPDTLDNVAIKEDLKLTNQRQRNVRSKFQNAKGNFQNNQRFNQKYQRNKESSTVHINPNFKGQVQVGNDARFVLNARKMDSRTSYTHQERNKNIAFIQPWANSAHLPMQPPGSMVSSSYQPNFQQPPVYNNPNINSAYHLPPPPVQPSQHHLPHQQFQPVGLPNDQSRTVLQIPVAPAAPPVRSVFANPNFGYPTNQNIPFGTNQNAPQYTLNQPIPFSNAGNSLSFANQTAQFTPNQFQQPPPLVPSHYNQQQLPTDPTYSQFYVPNNQVQSQPFTNPPSNFMQQQREEFSHMPPPSNSNYGQKMVLKNNSSANMKRSGFINKHKFHTGNFNQPKRRIENNNLEQRRKKRSLEREKHLYEVPIDTQDTTVTTTEGKQEVEEEDELTKDLRLKIEEQKRRREMFLREKEERRKQAAKEKAMKAGNSFESNSTSAIQNTTQRKQFSKQISNVKKNVAKHQTLKVVTTTNQINPNKFQQQQQQTYSNNLQTLVTASVLKNANSSGGVRIVSKKTLEGAPTSGFLENRKVLARDDNLPDTSIVVVSNLAAGTTDIKLRKMCQNIGNVEKLQMSPKERQATIQFKSVASAHAFFKKYQRFMLDLSMIQVTLKQVS
ncbi:uncharacterized protein LOC108734771 isoform X2 [Agrilus planipennis]|uniref:Uncharacterized protein LOC108734771 isoform X2 n=1 Tax=Agrilus planipennis TaxID=224129 RepID=A0A1W4WDB2_AGRPL|nr:uncharacterized protein LOC108734771 isoform X2 [Agrilus planipennis]